MQHIVVFFLKKKLFFIYATAFGGLSRPKYACRAWIWYRNVCTQKSRNLD